MPWTDREPSGRKTRPKKIIYGESCEHWSTQERNSALSDLKEAAANESIVLSADWHRYLEYVNVIAEELSPTDKGAAFKNLALQDARSRHDSEPSQFPAELGTPAEFKERLAGHEFEIRTRFNRREQVIAIRVYQLPPDEYENLDPSEEPPGHWEGLKWIPDPE